MLNQLISLAANARLSLQIVVGGRDVCARSSLVDKDLRGTLHFLLQSTKIWLVVRAGATSHWDPASLEQVEWLAAIPF